LFSKFSAKIYSNSVSFVSTITLKQLICNAGVKRYNFSHSIDRFITDWIEKWMSSLIIGITMIVYQNVGCCWVRHENIYFIALAFDSQALLTFVVFCIRMFCSLSAISCHSTTCIESDIPQCGGLKDWQMSFIIKCVWLHYFFRNFTW
jgi:hypothetical protein